MKKIFTFLLVSLFTAGLFAAGTKYESFGFHFSIPYLYETQTESGIKVETTMSSIGFGIHSLSMYSDKIGLYVNGDLVLPQTIEIKASYGGRSETISINKDDYKSIYGVAAFFGPAFKLSESKSSLVTLAPGLHYNMINAEGSSTVKTYLVGIGANIQDSLFFSNRGYFTFGIDLVYDFYGKVISNGSSQEIESTDFYITPRIGAGLRF